MRSGIFLLGILCLMAVSSAAAAADEPQEQSQISPAKEQYTTLDSLFTLYQPYLANISAYEPIYFLVGADPSESKFQISFKYRFFNAEGQLVKDHSWLSGFHFGYTQTSFWDLQSESFPFDDSSYRPEFFHLTGNLAAEPPWLQGFFVKTALQHESNGQSGELSRSTNTASLQPILVFYDPASRFGLSLGAKLWSYIDNSDSNPDLPDYRGYFQLDLKVGKADSIVIGSTLGWAAEGGSFSLDVTLPMDKFVASNLQFYFHVQYVSVLAESLLHYEERTEAVRLGFSFVR